MLLCRLCECVRVPIYASKAVPDIASLLHEQEGKLQEENNLSKITIT